MDNVIWLVLAAAVFIAAAGIVLFIAGDSLTNADDSAEDLQDPDDYIDDSYTDNSDFNLEKSGMEKPIYVPEYSLEA
jgi:hypothetical protein